jgi:adenine deaminase
VNVSLTIAASEVVAEEGRMTAKLPAFEYPDYALQTVKLKNGISLEIFDVRASSGPSCRWRTGSSASTPGRT